MKTITIGKTESGEAVTIDVQRLIDTRMLIQANSGGGKSWMLRLLAEGIGQVVPITLLDIEGEFASLREQLDILLVGRDLPCSISTAAPLALKLQESQVSAQVDLYELNHQNRREYVRRFLESMMSLPKRMWTPRVVFVDEAHAMCPEGGQSVAADEVAALMCQGRKRDFCGIMATQRLSKLNKDAAAEANNVLIGRTTLDVDQKRAGQTLGFTPDQARVLRELDEGWFYGFGPAFNHKGVFKFKSGEVKTTHGREASRATLPNPSRSMGAAIAELADLAERSKVEVLDIDAARAKIAELKQALASAKAAKPASPPIDMAPIVEKAKAQGRAEACRGIKNMVRELRMTAGQLAKRSAGFASDVESLSRSLSAFETILGSGPEKDEPRAIVHFTTNPPAPAQRGATVKAHTPRIAESSEGDSSVSGGERAILIACAQHEGGCDREQIGVLTGYKRSTRDAYIQRLRTKGYLADGEPIAATDAGIDALGVFDRLPTGDALRMYWLNRLPEGEQRVLEAVCEAYPNPVARERIGDLTDYKRSTRDAYLQRLGARKLVKLERGGVVASELLFGGAA